MTTTSELMEEIYHSPNGLGKFTEDKVNQYILTDKDYSYFKKRYGVKKNSLVKFICLLEELDRLISERRVNALLHESIGGNTSHITQAAEMIGLSSDNLMKIVPDLERFNENLKGRSFWMIAKKYRRIFGLTADELAKIANVSPGFIDSIESGIYFPMPDKAAAIANALHLTGTAKKMYFQTYRKERGRRSLTSRHKPPDNTGVGSKLRQLRISAGLSQKELSKKSAVAAETLCIIERGNRPPSERILKKITKVYRLKESEVDELLKLRNLEKANYQRRKSLRQPSYSNTEERMQVHICKSSTGKMLRSLREREGISQATLAECLGTHYSQISHWESNRKPINKKYINGIAEFLNLFE